MSSSCGSLPFDWKSTAARRSCSARSLAAEMRPRHGLGLEHVAVALRRVEGRVRVVGIDAQEPWAVPVGLDERDRALGAPGRLVQLLRHAVEALGQLAQHGAFASDPIGVVVAFRPVVARGVAVREGGVAVIRPLLDAMKGARQMQLADQAAGVAGIGHEPRHQRDVRREVGIAVAVHVHGARVHAGEEGGPRRRADRRLAIGVGEGRAALHQRIDRRRRDMRVAERADRVEALLVGAEPEDVGSILAHGCLSSLVVIITTFPAARRRRGAGG